VVCVSQEKKPIGSWNASERGDKPPRCKHAVAVTGNFFADEQYKAAAFDIDDINTKIFEEAFGQDWRKYLCGQPWSFCVLTGPRPKHLVECEGEDCVVFEDKEHTKAVKAVKLNELERGLAIVVRIPAKCIKGDFGTVRSPEVEVIYNNYQVVFGRHPSGVCYQPVKWENDRWVPIDTPGAGVVLSCEEFFRVVGLIRGKDEEKDEGEGKAAEPPKAWDNDIANPDMLVALLKRWWPLTGSDGGHFHDALTFGIASVAWRYGVKKEAIAAVFEELFKWAVEQGLDTERDVAHHRSVIDWVYSADTNRRRWGGRKVKEVLQEVLKAEKEGGKPTELEVEEIFSAILKAFGVKERRPEDVTQGVLCVSLRWVTDGRGNAIAAEWLCNTEAGIIVRKYRTAKKKKKGGEGEDGGREGDGKDGSGFETMFDENLLVDVSISALTVYADVMTSREYVDAQALIGRAELASWRMKPRDSFVAEVEKRALVRTSPKWPPLINYYPHVYDVIISGFFCPNPDDPLLGKLACGVRDYFHAGIRDSDKNAARSALQTTLSVFDKFAPDNNWFKIAATALAQGLAQVFFLTRKAWRVRPSFLVYEGPKGLGKSTIALLVLYALFPLRASDLFIPASGTMSPARLGRLQNEIVSGVVVLDEQKGVLQRSEVMEVLKSMISNMVAWQIASGEKWPAAAGLIITANKFMVTDPELADKLYKIQFSGAVDQAKRPEFAAAVTKLSNIVGDFGGYYLHYAERNWATVKDAILAPSQVEAAERYAKIIADELGVPIELMPVAELSAVPATVTPLDIFREIVWQEIKTQMMAVRDDDKNISAIQAFNILLDKYRIPFLKPYGDGTYVAVLKNLELRNGELTVRGLCEELGGELYTKGHKNGLYGACIVDRAKLQDVLFTGDEPEDDKAEGQA
ncbi:MAG: hypothetical protein JHC22_01120, partial [Thermoproteus sp.]|nr:hypothetical protein [Thermoproteus sp.]